ncbi:MAG: hypothetical protein IPP72_00525 [Chitinophagaceae bacterium]|nr:hypothetical protein [Chitinophagaceae bacterium]
MADNSNNILKQLQQLEILPPAGAFEKAWQAIVQNELAAEGDIADAERIIFARLQEHELAAPPLDFSRIHKTTEQKINRIIPVYWLRAAAVLLLVAAGSILYFSVFRKNENSPAHYAGTGMVKDSAGEIAKNDTADSASRQTASVNTTPAVVATEVQQKKTIANNFVNKTKRNANANFSSGEGQLYENDVLLTLVNYKSQDWEAFFTKAVTEKRITLNKYSYHNLSDKMVELLQETYLTKNNGKPARKARKTSRKFEKWRKKDEKYFDKYLQKNPADIIDLSEFILKKN